MSEPGKYYTHTWSAESGFSSRIKEFGCDAHGNENEFWIHPTRRLTNFLAFTLNFQTYYWLDSLEPAQRIEFLKKEFPKVQKFKRHVIVCVTKQNDEAIAWTDQKELNFYLKSQLSDKQKMYVKGDIV